MKKQFIKAIIHTLIQGSYYQIKMREFSHFPKRKTSKIQSRKHVFNNHVQSVHCFTQIHTCIYVLLCIPKWGIYFAHISTWSFLTFCFVNFLFWNQRLRWFQKRKCLWWWLLQRWVQKAMLYYPHQCRYSLSSSGRAF